MKYRLRMRLLLWRGRLSCQVVEAWFIYGPQHCGVRATHIVKSLDTGEDFPVCQVHYEDYKRLEREAHNDVED